VTTHDVSRRRLLQGMAALAGATAGLSACTSPARSGAPALPRRASNGGGLNAYVMGLHLHASTSEGTGSVRSHLAQAAATGFDVAWFTEHDWRRRRLLYRPSFSFDDAAVHGGTWTLPALPVQGSADRDSGGQVVAAPVSPNDPSPTARSLRLRVTGTAATPAVVGNRISSEHTSRGNYRSRIAGRTLSIDVLPSATGPDAWGEVACQLSHHPGAGDRPTGICSLVYRLRTDVRARAVSREGTTGFVDVPVTAGRWQTVALDLTADVGRVWRDVEPRDNSLSDIRLSAVSRNRAPAELFFGYLRFDEQTGYDAVGVEHDLMAAYADEVPDVLGLVGTEISLGPHLNQFGGPQDPYPYGSVPMLAGPTGDIRTSVVDFIHAQGGLASINHPSRPTDYPAETTTAQAIAHSLLTIGAGGADLLEVGYGHGGTSTLPDHLAVWDTLSRNGLFITGNGVSDDHSGEDWATQPNRFYTAAWSSARTEPALMGALAQGRAYVGYLGAFGGTIDMSIDDVPMGAVSVRARRSATLRLGVTGLPAGGAVQVVRGDVDYAGRATPEPGTRVLTSRGAADLSSNREYTLDSAADCFVRLQVVDAAGTIVAFGQPTWLLTTPPPHGVPAPRRTTA
jgi:hypothetical protein